MATNCERSAARTLAACVLVAMAAFWLAGNRPAEGQQSAEPPKFEYTVQTVEANALQAKLTELGNQGWELVTMTVVESRVDGANNPPKVITEKYDVTCKKLVKK